MSSLRDTEMKHVQQVGRKYLTKENTIFAIRKIHPRFINKNFFYLYKLVSVMDIAFFFVIIMLNCIKMEK